MFGFFKRKKSKELAKNRLKLILSYDRAGISPGKMENLKNDLLEVMRKYFPAGKNDFEVSLEQQGSQVVFVANLPDLDSPKTS